VSLGIIDFFIEIAFVAGLWTQFKKLRWEYNQQVGTTQSAMFTCTFYVLMGLLLLNTSVHTLGRSLRHYFVVKNSHQAITNFNLYYLQMSAVA
jgi:hypothetical protein